MNLTIRISIFGLLTAISILWPPSVVAATLPQAAARQIDKRDRQLWRQAVTPYLRKDLWRTYAAYYAGHSLMVPLHAAFQKGETQWQKEMGEHFTRFMEDGKTNFVDNVLVREQYLYLCSRFLVLANQAGRVDLIPAGLENLLMEEVGRLWKDQPWPKWNGKKFTGIRDSVLWRLQVDSAPRSYYRAIDDRDLFLLALAAELRHNELVTGRKRAKAETELIDDVLAVAKEVFQRRVVYDNQGRWVFQPGVWADHPDFVYAGNPALAPRLQPRKVPDVAEDSSHSHRMPMWLTSFAQAYPRGSTDRRYYESLKRGLEKQFYEKVLVPPSPEFPGYRMTNFMDGRNGVYRWEYKGIGKNNGYGPYAVSGALLEGWWSFLDSPRIREVYQKMAAQFPLPAEVEALYLGPGRASSAHVGEIRELIVRLAGKLDSP